MSLKIKEQKLRKFAKSVIDNPKYKKEIKYILSKLNLKEEEVIQAYVNYNLDVYSYGNEIYESLALRVTLYVHYLLKGSFHQERQQIMLDMIEEINPKTIVDVGFGAPTKYVKYLLKNKKSKLTLVDMYDSALKFSEVLLDYLDPSWKEIVSLKKFNMNSRKYIGNFDVYIFQDSIEHVNHATKYMSMTVKNAPKDSYFLISLPIMADIRGHTISWKTFKEAKEWLNKCGLKINSSKNVDINSKIDLFAEQLDKFHNLMVSCSKND
ncbi:hypothetical protein HYX17_01155 [Candidatus Woesearchaeota archaeon]|nr:hypothetical protein [Candidatus Woesearchaeota archaeon]